MLRNGRRTRKKLVYNTSSYVLCAHRSPQCFFVSFHVGVARGRVLCVNARRRNAACECVHDGTASAATAAVETLARTLSFIIKVTLTLPEPPLPTTPDATYLRAAYFLSCVHTRSHARIHSHIRITSTCRPKRRHYVQQQLVLVYARGVQLGIREPH